MIPVRRGLVDGVVPGHAFGVDPGAVDLDVVGMAVSAVRVVDGDDIGAFLLDHRGQPCSRLARIGVREGVGVLVAARAGHPRIAVAEGHHPGGTQRASGLFEFLRAPCGERFAGCEQSVGILTAGSVGGDDEHDPVSGVGGQAHHAAGEEHLVVGVRVEAQQNAHGVHAGTLSGRCGG